MVSHGHVTDVPSPLWVGPRVSPPHLYRSQEREKLSLELTACYITSHCSFLSLVLFEMQHKFGGFKDFGHANALFFNFVCDLKEVRFPIDGKVVFFSEPNSQVQVRVRLWCYLTALLLTNIQFEY